MVSFWKKGAPWMCGESGDWQWVCKRPYVYDVVGTTTVLLTPSDEPSVLIPSDINHHRFAFHEFIGAMNADGLQL